MEGKGRGKEKREDGEGRRKGKEIFVHPPPPAISESAPGHYDTSLAIQMNLI